MKSLFKDKLLVLIVCYLLVVLIAIPLTLFTLKKPTDTQTNASGTAILSYTPPTVQKSTGESFSLDVMLNPGTHSVSFVTLDVLYDPTKLSVNQSSAFQVNTLTFPVVIEGPVFTPGRIRANLSIGSDPLKALTVPSKVATITFTAESPTNNSEALVHFGESSFVLSIGQNDNATDNVLGEVSPVNFTITGSPTGNAGSPVVPVPTFGGGLGGPQFTPNPGTPIPSTNITPNPTCVPLPPECINADEQNELPICTNPPSSGYCTGDTNPTPTPAANLTDTPLSCSKRVDTDVMLVMDSSTSMHGEKIAITKQSAKSFISLLGSDPKNNFAVVTFDKTARILSSLSDNVTGTMRAIDEVSLLGRTCLKCGIEAADDEFTNNGRADAEKIMIILTDGRANTGGTQDNIASAEQAALTAITNMKTKNVKIYTIGVGSGVNQTLLSNISNSNSGLYYFAAQPIQIDDNFKQIFQQISDDLCQIVDTLLTADPSINLPAQNQLDPTTIMLIILLFLPLLLLIGHLLV